MHSDVKSFTVFKINRLDLLTIQVNGDFYSLLIKIKNSRYISTHCCCLFSLADIDRGSHRDDFEFASVNKVLTIVGVQITNGGAVHQQVLSRFFTRKGFLSQ